MHCVKVELPHACAHTTIYYGHYAPSVIRFRCTVTISLVTGFQFLPLLVWRWISVFAQLTAESPYTLQWAAPFPPRNCPFAWGSEPHLIMLSWAHPSSQPKRHLDRFSRFCTAHTYTLQWTIPSSSKLFLCRRDLDHCLMRGSLGPLESTPQTYLDRFSHFCGAHDRDRPTDRLRYSVCNNRSYIPT